MPRSLIIGSGPAAAGVALALTQACDEQVTILDIGARLEAEPARALSRMAEQPASQWDPQDVDTVRRQPVSTVRGQLPQKRAYGSDFPFRDLGQLAGIDGEPTANRAVVSGAYGGFSNVWGAQIMPFSRSTFARWPITWDEMEPHYRAILREVPLAADPDDYDEHFPLLTDTQALPPLAARTVEVLRRYDRRRAEIRALGITVGKARLAFAAGGCVRCGLCMTGCPRSLIYSASQTFDRLRRARRVEYLVGPSRAQDRAARDGGNRDRPEPEDRGGPPVRGGPHLRRLRGARHDPAGAGLVAGAAGFGRAEGVGPVRRPVPVAPARPRSARRRAIDVHTEPVQHPARLRRSGIRHVADSLLPVQPCVHGGPAARPAPSGWRPLRRHSCSGGSPSGWGTCRPGRRPRST